MMELAEFWLGGDIFFCMICQMCHSDDELTFCVSDVSYIDSCEEEYSMGNLHLNDTILEG